MEEKIHSNTGGRIPPQDIDAEKSLIGALLISDAALPEISAIFAENLS